MYTVDYFISKFSVIPDKYWANGHFRDPAKGAGALCAQGHCMGHHGIDLLAAMEGVGRKRSEVMKLLPEWDALYDLFAANIEKVVGMNTVAAVNNGLHPTYKQATERARILAALQDIKEKVSVKKTSEPVKVDVKLLALN